MTDANTDVYKLASVVRGLHIYKTIWTPPIDEMLQVHHAGRYTTNTPYMIGFFQMRYQHIERSRYRIAGYFRSRNFRRRGKFKFQRIKFSKNFN